MKALRPPFRSRFLRQLAIFPAIFALAAVAHALDLSVPANGDIQAAIDKVSSSGGGTVTLAAGTYTLADTLLLKSKVRLSGQGRDATVIVGGDFTVIKQGGEGLRNVVIEKLKVTGRPVKTCYGILVESYKIFHEGVTIRDVEVTGVGMGVHIKRASNVLVENSNLHGNGARGLEKYFHNLYIRSCEKVRVSGCLLNGSTSGNGLNVSYCKDVLVERTTAKDNFFRGMRAAETEGFGVVGCTIAGNGDIGLVANQEKGNATTGLDWRQNSITGNRQGGMRAIQGATGKAIGNTVKGNPKFDYSLPSEISQSDNV